MLTINMREAGATLSHLVESLESGKEREIIITRHGRPVARLVPMAGIEAATRLGVAKGRFTVPASIDDHAAEAAELFERR